ncbi:MAG TPA: S41 family peptidase [Caldilineaceae bacterium]|nr:S41 family peptidase [Caldilineaceae bacterium]
MRNRLIYCLVALLVSLVLPSPLAAAPAAQEDAALPPATITNDEGGPVRLVGSITYTDFSIPRTLQDPSPALLDMVHVVQDEPTEFAPVASQILGQLTSPVAPPPLSYAIDLPEEPTATLLDVDNDGEEDTGVQIFRLVVAANINGGSYLEQLDQAADLNSYLSDPVSGEITEGSLLVYAPDDAQGFPSGFGADGLLFTEDDPAVALPQGYTVVHFSADAFTFDRSQEAELNVLEEASAASPDFSDQGMVESFNTLIDHLAVRYAFTDLRNLDWEAMRAEYLPQVEEAEALLSTNPNAAIGVYANLLFRMAQTIRDAHVTSAITDPAYGAAGGVLSQLKLAPIATNVGANTIELSDGRIIVADIVADSPAAAAGWSLGTEIVAVDGTPVAERIPTIVYNETTGTDESQRLFQVNNLLKFPADAGEVTIDAILPGDTDPQSFSMTPAPYPLVDHLARLPQAMPISYRVMATQPAWGYLTWRGFLDPEVHMAVQKQFLTDVAQAPAINGIILDLRGNGGGWDLLYFTMASYFFNAENPVSIHWIDQDSYDAATNSLVRETALDYLISAPQPELYYGGPLVVLVDQNCASSCEFFAQFLQTAGRATVVAQYGSKGAGAPINEVQMPFGIVFHYTKGRAYFAGTDEMNLEGTGVTPDVRVPTTVETVEATLAGEDPVLDAGLEVLFDKARQAMVDSINLVPLPDDAIPGLTGVYPEGWNPIAATGVINYVSPNSQYVFAYQAVPDATIAEILPQLGVTDPQAALLEERAGNELEWSVYGATDASNFAALYALAETTDGSTYIITVKGPPHLIGALQEGLLIPAIDAFALSEPE